MTEPTYSAEDYKHLAEARKADQEARYFAAKADQAELSAEERGLEMVSTRRGWREIEQSDNFRRVYRFNETVTPATARAATNALVKMHRMDPEAPIEVIFNSPGGSIWDGMALFDVIQDIRAAGTPVTTGTFGMAASMAGVLLQAGEQRWMSPQSWLLIHRASFGTGGATFDVEDHLELIKRIESRIIGIFVERSQLTEEELSEKWKRKDWWLTADQALELGLVDYLRGVV